MTLLHMDGFDLGDFRLKMFDNGLGGLNANTAFSSGRSLEVPNGGRYFGTNFTASSHIYTGCRVYIPSSGYSATLSIRGDSGGTEHITVAIAGDGSATLSCGGSSRATAPAGTFGQAATWFYVEVEATIADSGGVCNVRVNGNPTAVLTYTGDTKNGGTNTTIDSIVWSQGGNNNSTYYDDWYICNDQGSTNNSFLGDVRVYTLSPNGAGNYTQFTPSTGANYACVDEQPYSTTDYVGSPTSGNRDSYTLADLPAAVTTVFATQELAVAAKNDAGLQSIKQMMRVNSTDYETSATVLSPSYIALSNIREQNPNTSSAWTPSAINGTEIGVRVG